MTDQRLIDAIAEALVERGLMDPSQLAPFLAQRLESKVIWRDDALVIALEYIKQPTMAFPGEGPWDDLTPPAMPDPEWWVRNGYGDDAQIRLALATCIGMARDALRAGKQ